VSNFKVAATTKAKLRPQSSLITDENADKPTYKTNKLFRKQQKPAGL
jgi:hypothetical protein